LESGPPTEQSTSRVLAREQKNPAPTRTGPWHAEGAYQRLCLVSRSRDDSTNERKRSRVCVNLELSYFADAAPVRTRPQLPKPRLFALSLRTTTPVDAAVAIPAAARHPGSCSPGAPASGASNTGVSCDPSRVSVAGAANRRTRGLGDAIKNQQGCSALARGCVDC